eukprot:GHVL01042240.1.p1 GENE.GHVL01042240.1~~GHVL01042240.1.p1  ORF type:complete len:124 (+),score=22.66 GHVL01042240.1:434-805(+)
MSSNFFLDGVMKHFSTEFSSRFTLFVPDLPGFGRSKNIPSGSHYSINEQLDRLQKDVIEKYGIVCYHLVGHSYGGLLAVELAARNPSAVKSIIILAPSIFKTKEEAQSSLLRNIAWPFNTVRK